MSADDRSSASVDDLSAATPRTRLQWVGCLLDPAHVEQFLAEVNERGAWQPIHREKAEVRFVGISKPDEFSLQWLSAQEPAREPAEAPAQTEMLVFKVPEEELEPHREFWERHGWHLMGSDGGDPAEPGWFTIVWRSSLMQKIADGEPIGTDWDGEWKRTYQRARNDGFDDYAAKTLAEYVVRSGRAQEEGRPFYYEDVERELEELYLAVGAAPSGIVKAKGKVLAAARRGAAERGDPLEMALFFSYRESLKIHREHLAAQESAPMSAPQRRRRSNGPSGFIFFYDAGGGLFGFG